MLRQIPLALAVEARPPQLESDPFLRRKLADVAQQRIRNLHGCLHHTLPYGIRYMVTHISAPSPSEAVKLTWTELRTAAVMRAGLVGRFFGRLDEYSRMATWSRA